MVSFSGTIPASAEPGSYSLAFSDSSGAIPPAEIPVDVTVPKDTMANTGAQVRNIAGLADALLLAGAGVLLMVRRRMQGRQ